MVRKIPASLRDVRRKLKVGDKILFSELPLLKNKIEVEITNLIIANNFEDLFTKFDPVLAGWKKNDTPVKCAKDMSKYYSEEDQEKYGVVAIKVELGK